MGLRLSIMTATLCAIPAMAMAKPLSTDEAAVVGGWSAPGLRDVNRIYLAPIAVSDGCLRYIEGNPSAIEDHLTSDKPVLWKLHSLKPGRYALVGVGWGPPYMYGANRTDWVGVSRQRGRVWTVDISPGSVTYIGVWTIVSPYAQRFLIKDAVFDAGQPLAATLAEPVGPLAIARPQQTEVVEAKTACPTAASTPSPAP